MAGEGFGWLEQFPVVYQSFLLQQNVTNADFSIIISYLYTI
jgi:hypothetical protein